MRISDWSSDVCSSDLNSLVAALEVAEQLVAPGTDIGVVSRRHRAGVGDRGARRRGADRVGHPTGSGIALAKVGGVDLGVIAEAQQVVAQQPLEIGPGLFTLVGTVVDAQVLVQPSGTPASTTPPPALT